MGRAGRVGAVAAGPRVATPTTKNAHTSKTSDKTHTGGFLWRHGDSLTVRRMEPGEDSDNEGRDDRAAEKSDEPAAEAPDKKRPSSERREAKTKARDGRTRGSAGGAARKALMTTIVAAVVALGAGAAAGWFGHEARAKAKLQAESAPASSAGGGPCDAWQEKICASSGVRSAACQQAKSAMELLTPSTCNEALVNVPATIAKIKAARASCDTLAAKLCKDLPPGSATCDMVKERTPSFPPERCKAMLDQYDQVLTELKTLDAQGGPQGGMGRPPPGAMPHSGPPGAMPHSGPPGAMPHSGPPGAMPQSGPH